MSRPAPSRGGGGATSLAEPETVSPFLHDRGTHLYNPITGASIEKTGGAWLALSGGSAAREAAEPGVLEHLRAARFLIDDVEAEARRTHLLFLSLETATSCNHRRPFCPVSVDPRHPEVMPQSLF